MNNGMEMRFKIIHKETILNKMVFLHHPNRSSGKNEKCMYINVSGLGARGSKIFTHIKVKFHALTIVIQQVKTSSQDLDIITNHSVWKKYHR